MSKVTPKEVADKIVAAAQETAQETGPELQKEGAEAAAATKSFIKEVGEWLVAVGKAIVKFFKKLFKK